MDKDKIQPWIVSLNSMLEDQVENPDVRGLIDFYHRKICTEYAKQKCKEQRELCAEFDGVDIDHTNYPEPNLD